MFCRMGWQKRLSLMRIAAINMRFLHTGVSFVSIWFVSYLVWRDVPVPPPSDAFAAVCKICSNAARICFHWNNVILLLPSVHWLNDNKNVFCNNFIACFSWQLWSLQQIFCYCQNWNYFPYRSVSVICDVGVKSNSRQIRILQYNYVLFIAGNSI